MGGLRFHHARDLAGVDHAVVSHAPLSRLLPEPDCSDGCDPDDDFHTALWFDAAYGWIAERLGFWPIFLAVGDDDEDRRMTGYQDQWQRRRVGDGEVQRPASRVLLSWREPPTGVVFMDFNAWHMVLNSVEPAPGERHRLRVRPLSAWQERQVWKPSCRTSDWLRGARRNLSVQAVVGELDLRTADELWCRDQHARQHLIALGFAPEAVSVRRLSR